MGSDSPVFYYDLGSPYAYVAAARIDRVLPTAPQWRPVLLGGIFKAVGRSSWALTEKRAEGMAEIERRAQAYGLPPLRWPEPWPGDGLAAMRAATFAEQEGIGREYALAAFRLAFAEGRDLADVENLLDAARACGADPDRFREAIGLREVKDGLRASTEQAIERGVIGVPTVAVDGELYFGDDRLEEAAAALA